MSVYSDTLGYWYNSSLPGQIFLTQQDATAGQDTQAGGNSPTLNGAPTGNNFAGQNTNSSFFGDIWSGLTSPTGVTLPGTEAGGPFAGNAAALGANTSSWATSLSGIPGVGTTLNWYQQFVQLLTGYGARLLTIIVGLVVLAAGLFLLGKGGTLQATFKEAIKP